MPIAAELLINTRSRRSKENMRAIVDGLKAADFEILKVHAITRKVSLDTILSAIRQSPPVLLIVGGGDGTISTVVDALIGVPIEIGVIPLGTTNNFARSLGIPFELDAAIETIKTKKARSADLGLVNGLYFANVASIGLSARIAKDISNTTKQRWGRFAYTLEGIKQLIRHRPFVVTLQDRDNELSVTFETHQVVIANGRYHAGKEISQDTKVDNGQLVIFALGGRSKLSLLKHMADFYFGNRKRIVHQSYYVGRHIKLMTSTPQSIEFDGEVKLVTPLEASVESAAVRIRY